MGRHRFARRKYMADLKPFLIHLGGEERIIEAVNLGVALVHAVKDLTKAKPATGTEVTRFLRAGKTIERVGEGVIDATGLLGEANRSQAADAALADAHPGSPDEGTAARPDTQNDRRRAEPKAAE
jgi:hypothetical protein